MTDKFTALDAIQKYHCIESSVFCLIFVTSSCMRSLLFVSNCKETSFAQSVTRALKFSLNELTSRCTKRTCFTEFEETVRYMNTE